MKKVKSLLGKVLGNWYYMLPFAWILFSWKSALLLLGFFLLMWILLTKVKHGFYIFTGLALLNMLALFGWSLYYLGWSRITPDLYYILAFLVFCAGVGYVLNKKVKGWSELRKEWNNLDV